MLDCADENPCPLLWSAKCGTENAEIVGLGCARGKDDFVRICADRIGDLPTRFLYDGAGVPAGSMIVSVRIRERYVRY
ncbi:hypothetical protein D3C81_1991150 [compost metagenome]